MRTELQRTVFTNRALGKNFKEISDICKITPGNAYNVFKQTIDTLQNDVKKGEESKKILDCLRFLYIDETDYEVWRYPMRLLAPHLIFPESSVGTAKELFGSGYRIYGFKKLATYGRRARVEDLILHTLRIDETAAKAISERNRDFINRDYLEKKIKEEGMEREAVIVSFDLDYGFDIDTKGMKILRSPGFALDNNMPVEVPSL